MAYVIHRKLHQKSQKSKWFAPNRKFKYLFWPSLILNAGLIGFIEKIHERPDVLAACRFVISYLQGI